MSSMSLDGSQVINPRRTCPDTALEIIFKRSWGFVSENFIIFCVTSGGTFFLYNCPPIMLQNWAGITSPRLDTTIPKISWFSIDKECVRWKYSYPGGTIQRTYAIYIRRHTATVISRSLNWKVKCPALGTISLINLDFFFGNMDTETWTCFKNDFNWFHFGLPGPRLARSRLSLSLNMSMTLEISGPCAYLMPWIKWRFIS